MAGDLDPRYPLGDCGDLLEYRRTATGMRPLDPRRAYGTLGHSYMVITCNITGFRGTVPAELARTPIDPLTYRWRLDLNRFEIAVLTIFVITVIALITYKLAGGR